MIACDGLPLQFVGSPYFRAVVASFAPEAPKLTRSWARQEIIKYGQQMLKANALVLRDSASVALAMDLWTGRDQISYLGVVAHCISTSWESSVISLDAIPMTVAAGCRTTGEEIAAAVGQLFDEMDRLISSPESPKLLSKVHYITVDGASNMRCAVAQLGKVLVPCAAHIVQLAVRDFCLSSPDIVAVLSCARQIAGSLSRSSLARQEIGRLHTMVRTRFDTAFLCLKGLLKHVDQLRAFEARTPALREAVEEFLSREQECRALLYTVSQIQGISDELSTHGDASIAWVLPTLASCAIKITIASSQESGVVHTQLLNLAAALRARVDNLFDNALHLAAFFLSPISSTDGSHERYLGSRSASAWTSFVSAYLAGNVERMVPIKGRSVLLPELVGTKTEIWQGRRAANFNVLQWFRDHLGHHEGTYQFIAGDAQRMLAAFATEVDVERMFSHAGIVLSDRRTNMAAETFRAILRVRMRANKM